MKKFPGLKSKCRELRESEPCSAYIDNYKHYAKNGWNGWTYLRATVNHFDIVVWRGFCSVSDENALLDNLAASFGRKVPDGERF